MGTSKFGGKYGSICGQIWVPDHDSQFAPLWTEIPLLETVGGCPNTVLSKDLNNPSQSKTKIRNWTKKTSVTGKTHNGQKKRPYGFPGIYIYIYISGILYLQWKIQSGNRLPQDHPAVKSSFCGRWSPNCCERNFLGKLVHVSTIHNRLYGFGGLAEIPVEQKETLAAGSL